MKVKLYLLAFTLLFVLAFIFMDTYALFETNSTADASFQMGRWIILLNDKDISLEKTITLDDFVYSTSSHTEDNYFAPGRSAEFILDMDVSLVDVSVDYSITIDDSSILEYPNIHFKIIDLDTNEEMISNTKSGTIYLTDTIKEKQIKVVLEWIDDEDYDESDTSLIGEELSFDVNVNFIQHID